MIETVFKNKIFFFCVFFAIVILGSLYSFLIRKEKLPEFPVPVFKVTTKDKNMMASEVYRSITKPIRSKVESISDLLWIRTISMMGKSIIEIVCDIDSDSTARLEQIKKRLNNAKDKLPEAAEKPIVEQQSITDLSVLWISLTSTTGNLKKISHFVENELKPKLLFLPNVKNIKIYGLVPKKIRVELDQVAMSRLGITLPMVYEAFKVKNLIIPAGTVNTSVKQYSMRLDFNLKTLEEMRHLIITYRAGKAIYLNQIAKILAQEKPEKQPAFLNEKPAVLIGVAKTKTGNTFTVGRDVKRILDRLSIPDEIILKTGLDQRKDIRAYLWSMLSAILYSLFFCVVTFYFLVGSLRLSMITAFMGLSALSCSVIALYAFNLSFNVLTLLCFVLLIALAIDDAIISVESYMAHLCEDVKQKSDYIAQKSCHIIVKPLITYGVCMVVVFLSLFSTRSALYILSYSLIIVIVPGVIFSTLNALTLAPLFCAYFVKSVPRTSHFVAFSQRRMNYLREQYLSSLRKLLKYPIKTCLVFFIIPLPLIYLLPKMQQNLFPFNRYQFELIGSFKSMSLISDSDFNNLLLKASKTIRLNSATKDVYILSSGANKAVFKIQIKQAAANDANHIIKDLQKSLNQIIGLVSNVYRPGILVKDKQPFRFAVRGPDYHALLLLSDKLLAKLNQAPKLGNVLMENMPLQATYKLHINRYAAAQVGLTAKSIAHAVSLFGGDIKVGRTQYLYDDDYDIYLYSSKNTLNHPSDLEKIYVYNNKGERVNLTSVASINIVSEPNFILAYNGKPSLIFESTPLRSLSEAQKTVTDILKPVLPKNTALVFGGQLPIMKRSFDSFFISIFLAVILMYFILTVQFKSPYYPLLVLFAQPIAISLVMYTLYCLGISINLFSLMGLFLLVGLKTKNCVLLVSLMNDEGMTATDLKEMIIDTCRRRFRPILITTLVIIFGLLPSVLINGPSQGYNISLIVPIISGVIASTIVSIYFLPIGYFALNQCRTWFKDAF